ncbi:MAG: lipocalin family protein [Acidiferrobacterales bacterium]|nr:lipocalin family protein [Acidiferrobacterales bacterium]
MSAKKLILSVTIGAIALIAIVSAVSNSFHPPLQTADYVDSNRFTGEWYVISNIPYFAERNKVASKTTYLKIGEHDYQDIYEAKEGSFENQYELTIGRAKCLNDERTKWQSTFFGFMRFRYEIIEMDEDYQIMLIGHRSRNYGWVMARESKISDQRYQRAMQTFVANGYDVSKFAKVPQHPSDLGQPGYQLIAND